MEEYYQEENVVQEQNSLKFMKDLLKEDRLHEKAEEFWSFIDKETILANVDEKDKDRIMRLFNMAETSYLLTQSRTSFTFEDIHQLNQIRAKLYVKILRAKEGFERKMLVSQIQQQTILTEQATSQGRGFLHGVKRFLGMG